MRRTDGLKDRVGRVAYVWTGSQNLRAKPFRAKIDVDGVGWYKGKASCILLGNVGELFGGVEAFEDATARRREARTRRRDGRRAPPMGPHARAHRRRDGEQIAVRANDEGALGEGEAEPEGPVRARRRRSNEAKTFKIKVEPRAITVCVPDSQLQPRLTARP